MRVARQHGLRLRNAHFIERFFRLNQRLFAAQPLMQADRLGNLLADGEHRVKRSHRFLKNHRDVGAAHAAHLRGRLFLQFDHFAIAPPQQHLVALHLAVGLFQQPHQRQRRHGLARTGLADNRQRLSPVQMKRELMHGAHGLLVLAKRDVQILNTQHLRDIKLVGMRHGDSFYSR